MKYPRCECHLCLQNRKAARMRRWCKIGAGLWLGLAIFLALTCLAALIEITCGISKPLEVYP